MTVQERIIDISKRHKLSHVGSCLSVAPILEEIYQKKKLNDIVILSNAHAHLAHLVVREKYDKFKNIEELLTKYGIHCDKEAGCDISGGSLGHGIGIGIGLALADRSRVVHVVTSDGDMMEGSCAEAIRIIKKLEIKNIFIYCNFNGCTALEEIDIKTHDHLLKILPDNQVKIYLTDNGLGEYNSVKDHYITL